MTPVKVSTFLAEKSCPAGFGFHESLLSKLGHLHMLAYYLSVFVLLLCISFNLVY
jgi:hypothetical protein